MKIGLYFGSFNPIHVGHLIIATYVANMTDLQEIWFVVSPQNPFKQSKTLLNEYDRLHLVELAIIDDKKIRASNIEFKLPKPSYTSDTLAFLAEKYPKNIFSIIMGSDSFQNVGKWKNGSHILNNYQLLVYLRPKFKISPEHPKNVTILQGPIIRYILDTNKETTTARQKY